MRRFLILTVVIQVALLAGALPAAAQDGLALMKVETGARPAGMAGAFASISGDPMSSAYNPAGAVGVGKFTASFGHNEYWENIRLESGYCAAPLAGNWYIHGGIRFAAVSDLESRLLPTSEPEGIFDAHDVSLKAGVAWQVNDMFAAGVAAGWFIEKIEAYQGSAFNVDIGLIARPMPNLSLGASASNLGSDFSLSQTGVGDSDDISLPTTYRIGGSYRYLKYLGAADLVVVDDETHLHLGIEGEIYPRFVLRSGYMLGYDVKNFAAGASFHVPRYGMVIDYGFVPYSEGLGSSHLFNLTVGL
jgi:long-subunit fatty acid transport protein